MCGLWCVDALCKGSGGKQSICGEGVGTHFPYEAHAALSA